MNNYTRFLISFPVPKRSPDFNIKEWMEEILAFVYKIYGCNDLRSYYDVKDLTFTVWFEYNKQEELNND